MPDSITPDTPDTTWTTTEEENPPGVYTLKLKVKSNTDPDAEGDNEVTFDFTLKDPCPEGFLTIGDPLEPSVTYILGEEAYSKMFSAADLLQTDRPWECGLPIFKLTQENGDPLPDFFIYDDNVPESHEF